LEFLACGGATATPAQEEGRIFAFANELQLVPIGQNSASNWGRDCNPRNLHGLLPGAGRPKYGQPATFWRNTPSFQNVEVLQDKYLSHPQVTNPLSSGIQDAREDTAHSCADPFAILRRPCEAVKN